MVIPPNVDEDARESGSLTLAGGNIKWYNH